jgi:hypothetical protein
LVIDTRHGVDISIENTPEGLVRVTIDGEVLFECTHTRSKLIFASLSRFFGKRESRRLINVKRGKSEKWT